MIVNSFNIQSNNFSFSKSSYEYLSQHTWEVVREAFHFTTVGRKKICHPKESADTGTESASKRQNAFKRDMERRIELPSSVKSYLNAHLRPNIITRAMDNPYSTYRDTTFNYKAWRRTISEEELVETQYICQDVLLRLRHRIFDNMEQVRNMSEKYVLMSWRPRILVGCLD